LSTHINTGVRTILENPKIYNLFHNLTGGNQFRSVYFRQYFDLPNGSNVLDFGCGSGVMLSKIKNGIHYHGVDFEESYIDYCRRTYGDRGTFIHQKVGEELRSEWLGYFDAINAHGLLHHLNDDDCTTLLETAIKYLKTGGYLVTFDPTYHDTQSSIQRWFISKDRGQNVKYYKDYLSFASKHFSHIDHKIFDNYTRMPYSAIAMKMTKG